MILRTCTFEEFISRSRDKEVVCYGAGNWLNILTNEFCAGIETVYSYAVDGDPKLWGSVRAVGEREIGVRPPQYLYNHIKPRTVVFITSFEHCLEIYETLSSRAELKEVECYTIQLLLKYENDLCYNVPPAPEGFRMNPEPVIPKVIHYIWLGGKPLPDSAKRCIESWKKFAPDYEIVEWNETNCDLTSHPYVYEAVLKGKWAFASDYMRLDIVYRFGGFYFDLDVELLKGIDELRYNSMFCGYQNIREINLGSGFGAVKGHSLVEAMRNDYDNVRFIHSDGKLNLTVCPTYQTQMIKTMGVEINGRFQVIEDCAIYPAIYFSPKSLTGGHIHHSPLSYSIHHYDASWLTEKGRAAKEAERAMFLEAMKNEERLKAEGGGVDAR